MPRTTFMHNETLAEPYHCMTSLAKTNDTPVSAPGLASEPPILSAEERAQVEKHYSTAKKELRELLQRKKQADKDLSLLEGQIYRLEGNYLEDTQQGGNIIRGFDGYLKGMINTRKSQFPESDRLFSLSSVSYSETAQPEKEIRGSGNKKKRRTLDGNNGDISSDEDGSTTQHLGNKRARISYAD